MEQNYVLVEANGYPMQIWAQMFNWIVCHTKRRTQPSKTLKLVYAEYNQAIEKGGNGRIFEGAISDHGKIVRELAYNCIIRAVGILKVACR